MSDELEAHCVRFLNATAQELKQMRDDRKLTSEDVYTVTEINVARIESGSIDMTLTTLEKLVMAYHTSLAELFVKVSRRLEANG